MVEKSPQVVIAGGGIAGLEALLALSDLAGDRVAVTLIAPEPDFTYRPLIVEEPFSFEPAERHELAPIVEERGGRFVQQGMRSVDRGSRTIALGDGTEIGYDAAVICIGARTRPAFPQAITFQAAGESLRLGELLGEGKEGQPKRIAFLVPPTNTWPLPIYELALMTQRRARELGRDIGFVVYTPEEAPLVAFGTKASEAVSKLLEARGIEVRTGARVHEDEKGELVATPGGERVEAPHVVALPELEGPAIPGLPADEGGFLPIDEHARVRGTDDVYAAGDGTNFPIKQGGLGTQQADAAAEHIAARFDAPVDPEPFKPVLRGKLITGDETLSMRANIAGGGGEGVASPDYLWWPPHKVSGRYLAPFLAGETPHRDPEPPSHPIDVEIALPTEWHREPMALDPYA
jgi:sulfide:quinone oxidoreductase